MPRPSSRTAATGTSPPDVLEDVDRVVALEGERRGLLQAVEEIRRRQNEVAQATGRERDPEKRSALIEEGKRLKSQVAEEEERLRRLEAELNQRLRRIPNLTHPDAPVGLTEDESRELRKVGTPRAFDFKPKDHVELGKDLDLIDFETAGKVSGTGLLFPQERRRPPRPGTPAVRPAKTDRRRVHAHHHARPGPQ